MAIKTYTCNNCQAVQDRLILNKKILRCNKCSSEDLVELLTPVGVNQFKEMAKEKIQEKINITINQNLRDKHKITGDQ